LLIIGIESMVDLPKCRFSKTDGHLHV